MPLCTGDAWHLTQTAQPVTAMSPASERQGFNGEASAGVSRPTADEHQKRERKQGGQYIAGSGALVADGGGRRLPTGPPRRGG